MTNLLVQLINQMFYLMMKTI